MNELRIFIIALLAVVVGFAGAWMMFGTQAAKLASENDVLRQQAGQLIQQLDDGQFSQRRLIGRWATTVEKARSGKIELIVTFNDDGSVAWESASGGQRHPIAEGQWKFQSPAAIDFDLLIVNERSPDKGQRRSTLATIRDATPSCLVLDVDGSEWVFLRTS
jgi:hypothetical protein